MKTVEYTINSLPKFVVVDDEAVEKTVKNLRRRKGIEKDSIVVVDSEPVAEEIAIEEVVEDAADVEGLILFSTVAKQMGVRYQQVFQKHRQGKLDSVQVQGKWYASTAMVDLWNERRMKYLSAAFKDA